MNSLLTKKRKKRTPSYGSYVTDEDNTCSFLNNKAPKNSYCSKFLEKNIQEKENKPKRASLRKAIDVNLHSNYSIKATTKFKKFSKIRYR